jgi:hypothetical protein
MTTLTALATGRTIDGTIVIVPASRPRSEEWHCGWSVYRRMLPVGAWIRSNEQMAGWLAAREDHRAVDVDRGG